VAAAREPGFLSFHSRQQGEVRSGAISLSLLGKVRATNRDRETLQAAFFLIS
jgi:hypothetical protein